MTFPPAEAHAGLRRRRSDEAIQLAMQGRWKEAVDVNRSIIELHPTDVDAWNRLGKAFSELGSHRDAVKAYDKALEIEPGNQIARRNLERLKSMAKVAKAAAPAPVAGAPRMSPKIFLEETGKTGVTTLHGVPGVIAAKLRPGDRVDLVTKGAVLTVQTVSGEDLGLVEPKMAARLLRLMKGGNEYAAAVSSVADGVVRVVIKETYQHPSQAGKPSFPAAAGGEAVRPYIKEGLLRYEAEEEEEEAAEEAEEAEDWEAERETQEGHVRLFEAGTDADESTFDE